MPNDLPDWQNEIVVATGSLGSVLSSQLSIHPVPHQQVIGAGGVFPLAFTHSDWDDLAAFNAGHDTFTCPSTGLYLHLIQLSINSANVNIAEIVLQLVFSSLEFGMQATPQLLSTAISQALAGAYVASISRLQKMTVGDTAKLGLVVQNAGTYQLGTVDGTSTGGDSWWSVLKLA